MISALGEGFSHAISCYDHGAVGCLAVDHPILYCGMQILQKIARAVSMSKKDFYSKLAPLGAASIVKNGKFSGQ